MSNEIDCILQDISIIEGMISTHKDMLKKMNEKLDERKRDLAIARCPFDIGDQIKSISGILHKITDIYHIDVFPFYGIKGNCYGKNGGKMYNPNCKLPDPHLYKKA